jgi:hypothetical protein
MSRVPAEHLFSDRTKAFAQAIRKSMLKTISAIPDREVSVFLSSGVDSNACLAACLWSDKVPIMQAGQPAATILAPEATTLLRLR